MSDETEKAVDAFIERHRPVIAAKVRLDKACRAIAAILDGGDRDPTWHESHELEEAAIALGRLLNKGER